MKKYRKDTIVIHGGHEIDSSLSRAVPIYQTTSYLFKDSEHASRLFELSESGNIYTRIMNPTTDVLEKRVAELENGVGALAVSSGQAAITLSILNITMSGDNIVSANNLYGGTYNLFCHTLPRFGITVQFAEAEDVKSYERLINKRTRALYAESVGNPRLNVVDLDELSRLAHEYGIPLIVDNTVAPYLLQPFEYGVDIVVYSATKFLGGHGNSIGGIIVDSGRFNWAQHDFESIAGDDTSYHGMNFVKSFGALAYIVKARAHLLRDLGPAISPLNAFLILQGMETLHLRMVRHSENAMKIARWLSEEDRVSWVNYPGLPSGSQYVKAQRYLRRGFGALIGFGIRGGYSAARDFIDSVGLISHVANIGDVRTLVIHPASTTHQQLTADERHAAGVTDDFIRLSVGLEDPDDLIEDIEQALG